MGSVLCEHCPAACCRYVALPLDNPTTARDYDDIRWYLMHEGVTVFVEDGDWYVQFQTTCKKLGEDSLCTVYETRPRICAAYEANGCDYSDASYGYDHLFTHPEQIVAFYEKRTGRGLAAADTAVSHQGPKRRSRKRTARRASQTS